MHQTSTSIHLIVIRWTALFANILNGSTCLCTHLKRSFLAPPQLLFYTTDKNLLKLVFLSNCKVHRRRGENDQMLKWHILEKVNWDREKRQLFGASSPNQLEAQGCAETWIKLNLKFKFKKYENYGMKRIIFMTNISTELESKYYNMK